MIRSYSSGVCLLSLKPCAWATNTTCGKLLFVKCANDRSIRYTDLELESYGFHACWPADKIVLPQYLCCVRRVYSNCTEYSPTGYHVYPLSRYGIPYLGQREGGEKGSSFHCLLMHFNWGKIPLVPWRLFYVWPLVTSKWIFNATWSIHLHMYHSTEHSVHYKRS